MTNATDKQITGELAKEIAEIAALPVQQTRLREWKALNALKPCHHKTKINELAMDIIRFGIFWNVMPW